MNDISKDFRYNYQDAQIGRKLVQYEATPRAITYFAEVCHQLTDHAYWFYLSTLWVSYSGQSDLQLWRKLFSSDRTRRKQNIMKPSELKEYEYLPHEITAYRAHRPGETDWIAYTTNPITAARFARERDVNQVHEYRIKKRDITALFLRRGEDEIIMLHPERAQMVNTIDVLTREEWEARNE